MHLDARLTRYNRAPVRARPCRNGTLLCFAIAADRNSAVVEIAVAAAVAAEPAEIASENRRSRKIGRSVKAEHYILDNSFSYK